MGIAGMATIPAMGIFASLPIDEGGFTSTGITDSTINDPLGGILCLYGETHHATFKGDIKFRESGDFICVYDESQNVWDFKP